MKPPAGTFGETQVRQLRQTRMSCLSDAHRMMRPIPD